MMLASLAMLLFAQPTPPDVKLRQAEQKAAAEEAVAKTKGSAATSDSDLYQGDELALKAAYLDVTGPALVTLFQHRSTSNVEPKHLAKLTEQLSDKSETVRSRAAAELVGLGPLAVTALRLTANHADDEETVSRARKCLEAIEGRSGATLMQSAVRLMAARSPEGATEALLNYLPFADDDTVVQEIESSLRTIGARDGKAESALLRALGDATPIRRGIAARVLCQLGGASGRKAVRPLLKDGKPSVRMLAALSLADVNEAEAIPALIDLLPILAPEGRKRVETYLGELAGEWAVKAPPGSDVVAGQLRRELWSAWWKTLDGKKLLEEFHSRSLRDEERTRVLGYIAKLDDDSAEVRAKASEQLLGMGPRVASLLRQTINQGDPRLIDPARQCLEALERDEAKPLPESAPRLLALRRPAGTIEALLTYIPFAETDTQAAQLTDLLATLGCSDGKADPLLIRALADKVNVRRATIAVALCKGKADDALPAVRKLLQDADASVRMRTALALMQRGDKTAVPVLIALLADLPLDQVWEVEETLLQLAGEKAPKERIGEDKPSRTASVKAWNAWWQKEQKNVDLAVLTDPSRESSLLLAIENQAGRVVEMTRRGQVRWKIEGLQWPQDALICPNGNVLIINMSGSTLSLRDRHGKEIWQKGCNNAFHCQRLRNGHFFVACHQQLMEFDANGKELSNQFQNMGWIVGATKFPNGHTGLFTNQGQYIRLDATGKQVKTYQAMFQGGAIAIAAEVLPNDRVIASLHIGQVAEFSDQGKEIWKADIPNPGCPLRLPNGHTLVTQNGATHLYELDRNGKILSEKKDLECAPWRIRRR
jgi:HEAT repeat protein